MTNEPKPHPWLAADSGDDTDDVGDPRDMTVPIYLQSVGVAGVELARHWRRTYPPAAAKPEAKAKSAPAVNAHGVDDAGGRK